ncbi:MAG: hypothetical protein GX414_09735 [Acidobacteria bacterium]|nr:hypothetical protein [Acidobacteriota bacterium]
MTPSATTQPKSRWPWTPVLLSLLVCPGLGQWNLGRRLAGFIQGGLAIGILAVFLVAACLDVLTLVPAEPPLDPAGMLSLSLDITHQVMARNRTRFLVTCLAFGVVYAYSAAEAFWLVWRAHRRAAPEAQSRL